jgi:hypothetical protein
MSMNYSEFVRQLGTDPASQDPAFLLARQSSPQFVRAAAESDRFEKDLRRALQAEVPADLLERLQLSGRARPGQRIARYALAASLVLAVLLGTVMWRLNPRYETVEQYVAYHYQHDGPELLARGAGRLADNSDRILSRFGLGLTPAAQRMVGVIKFCPTPAGRGVHMVLNTANGPVTVLFMPGTAVTDGEMLHFDGLQAQLVHLDAGSAAIIGTAGQHIAGLHDLVQNAFIGSNGKNA